MEYPFWVNNFDRVKDHRLAYPSVAKIFEQPVSFWYGDRQGKHTCNIDDGLGYPTKDEEVLIKVFFEKNLENSRNIAKMTILE